MPRWKRDYFGGVPELVAVNIAQILSLIAKMKASYSYLSGNKHLVRSFAFDGFGLAGRFQ